MPFFLFFIQKGGGGVGGNVKRLQSFFINHVFVGVFQYVPWPPKHVLHLVWSAYVISTALRTASKVAWRAQILGKTRLVSKTNKMIKRIDFEMGPSVKSVSRPMASTTTKISTKKFHFPTGLWRGGGSGPLHSKRLWKRAFFFAAFPK